MSTPNDSLDQVMNLSREQSAEPVQRLLSSLEGATLAPDGTDAQREELLRRLDSICAGTAKLRPWDDVQRDIEMARRARAET